jgi:hypothetical protein
MKKYKFLIKFPTRDRPEQFFRTLHKYYEHLSGNHEVNVLVTVDHDDQEMNNPSVRKALEGYSNLTTIFGTGHSKIEAINRNMDQAPEFDILLLASDDMVPVASAYDDFIASKFDAHFPDLDGVVWTNDGYVGDRINTLCILGKTYFDRFNYIYNPEYTSLYCDNEFTDVANRLKRQIYFDDVLIKHEHFAWNPAIERDPLYQRNESFSDQDQLVYEARKARGFDLSII